MPDLDKTGPAHVSHGSHTPTLDSPEMHGLGNPAPDEAAYIRQRTHSRLNARTVPALLIPPADPELGVEVEQPELDEGDAAEIEMGIGLFAGRHMGRAPSTPIGPIYRSYRELGPAPGVAGVDNNVWITLGTCATDKIWEIRNVLVFNSDPWTAGTAGALAAVFAGGFQIGSVKASDVISPGVAIPTNLLFSRDQQIVYGGETLYVVVATPGAGVYFASATVREYDRDIYRYAA